MKKRLLKVAVATALSVAFAVPAFANPFTDVPAKHWAYDAVNKLAQAGVVDGYGDGTFRGDKTMTRYEMAQVVAKAMTKSLNADQKALVDKLSKEYAAELNNLGVKVDALQGQVNDMVKFSGDARLRYTGTDTNDVTSDAASYRVRLGATAKINQDMSLYARFTTGTMDFSSGSSSPKIDNAYVSTKLFGADTKVGRQDYILGQGMLVDGTLNGVTVKYGDLMAFGGKEENETGMVSAYGGQYTFQVGAPVTLSYLKLDDTNYYAASTSFNLVPGFKVSSEYVKNDTDNAKGWQVKAALGKTGLSVGYKDIEQYSLPMESALSLNHKVSGMKDFYEMSRVGDVKGMEYEYNAALAKNTNLNILHQDIKDGGKNTRATINVKF